LKHPTIEQTRLDQFGVVLEQALLSRLQRGQVRLLHSLAVLLCDPAVSVQVPGSVH
jgi:hypothetical protein